MFYQGIPIDHCKNVPGLVDQSSAESEYNAACNVVMYLAHFSMLNIEWLNKGPYVVL